MRLRERRGATAIRQVTRASVGNVLVLHFQLIMRFRLIRNEATPSIRAKTCRTPKIPYYVIRKFLRAEVAAGRPVAT